MVLFRYILWSSLKNEEIYVKDVSSFVKRTPTFAMLTLRMIYCVVLKMSAQVINATETEYFYHLPLQRFHWNAPSSADNIFQIAFLTSERFWRCLWMLWIEIKFYGVFFFKKLFFFFFLLVLIMGGVVVISRNSS